MKYRTKTILLLTLLSVFTNGVLVLILYPKLHRMVFQQIQSKALSIATTAAYFMEGDLHAKIVAREDESTDIYKSIETKLKKVRDANRRDDVYVEYVYTLRLSPDDPEVIVFGVDAEESLENKSHVGDVYKGKFGIPFDIEKNEVDEQFTTDQWGTWLSASASIRDKSGRAVSSLGIDIKASDIIEEMNKIKIYIILALGTSIGLALAASFILSARFSKPLLTLRNALQAIGKGDLDVKVDLKSNDEFGEVARYVNAMTQGLRDKKTIKKLFSRYVSHQVAESILQSTANSSIQVNRKRITVLFSDIRGFTKMSEGMKPEDVVGILNEYFEKMIEVIYRNSGTLDKFMGDGMMVVFGAPNDDLEQEEHAINTALEMKEELVKLCNKWEKEGRINIKIGIGINSGNAVVGNIGSTERTEYTAIGDTVNLASRLETATKELGVDILISEYTYNSVRKMFKTKNMGSIQVRGRPDSLTVYSVIG